MRPTRPSPAPSPPPPPPGDGPLRDKLASIRARTRVTAVSVLVLQDNAVAAHAEAGLRRARRPDPVRAADAWHLASCGKAMTATMLARLVDRGALAWATPIRDHFPDAHPALSGATLRQLLSHTAGVARDLPLRAYLRKAAGPRVRARRDALAAALVRRRPSAPPGAGFAYSNAGYIVAAVLAERATGEDFESLMAAEVFGPLGMASAAYGAPPAPPPDGQAFGHMRLGPRRWAVAPARYAARSQHYAPASTVFMTMADWAKFAQAHLVRGGVDGQLDGAAGGFLRPETIDVLHTPVGDAGYALGWATKGGLLQHDGGNPFWASEMRLYPSEGVAILLAFNQCWDAAAKSAVRMLQSEVFPRYVPGDSFAIN